VSPAAFPYSVVVQASPDEIFLAKKPGDLNLRTLADWPSTSEIIVALPRLEGSGQAQKRLAEWGVKAFVGDAYNVCQRLVEAQKLLAPQSFIVRVLAFWKHIDLEYIDCLVQACRQSGHDLVAPPLDYDLTMAADVASVMALERIGRFSGEAPEIKRAHFNPWGYMEFSPESFQISHFEPAPQYSPEKVAQILAEERSHPECEYFGRDYSGSSYHWIVRELPAGLRILDIACGSGLGSDILSQRAGFVLGVDYSEAYLSQARQRFPETDRLRFVTADAQSFCYARGQPPFDVVVCLHTLEHVPGDEAMLTALGRNLRQGGLLILEVPLLFRRPLGAPINPYHLREYTEQGFTQLVDEQGLKIERVIGGSRGFYGPVDKAREAIQVWARKP